MNLRRIEARLDRLEEELAIIDSALPNEIDLAEAVRATGEEDWLQLATLLAPLVSVGLRTRGESYCPDAVDRYFRELVTEGKIGLEGAYPAAFPPGAFPESRQALRDPSDDPGNLTRLEQP